MLAWAISMAMPAQSSVVWARAAKNKKADVVEHPQALDHVGLLINEPPGRPGLLFS
jgi:hypothetical protein